MKMQYKITPYISSITCNCILQLYHIRYLFLCNILAMEMDLVYVEKTK